MREVLRRTNDAFSSSDVSVHTMTYDLEHKTFFRTINCLTPQDTPLILLDPNINYHIHNSAPLMPILSRNN